MLILNLLGYIFMGCGALILMIGFIVGIATGKSANVPLMAGGPIFLLGSAFVLLAHGISLFLTYRAGFSP